MKTNNPFLYLFVLIASLSTACTKDNPFNNSSNNSGYGRFNITGKFLQNCSGSPIANTSFTFWQPGVGGGDIGKVTTSADGSFSFNYNPINGATIKYGRLNQYGYVEYGQMQVGNYKNIKLYAAPTCYLKVSMQVYNNSYTNQDTLMIGDGGANGGAPKILKISGPFTSRTLYEIPNYIIQNYGYNGTYIAVVFRINNREFNQGALELKPCDTAKMVLEVR